MFALLFSQPAYKQKPPQSIHQYPTYPPLSVVLEGIGEAPLHPLIPPEAVIARVKPPQLSTFKQQEE